MKTLGYIILSFWFLCCSTDKEELLVEDSNSTSNSSFNAQVSAVSISGESNAYTVNITVASPDTGCEQYADWWEIFDLEGNLVYRRILAHSHVDEQPFTRSGSNIPLDLNREVYIRVHMNTTGYSSAVQKGSVANGFLATELSDDFALNLEKTAPLPTGCAF